MQVQELGETRQAMTRGVMTRLEKIINEVDRDEFYVLVHAKPFPNNPKIIKMKYLIMSQRPSMMLSCMLFHIDNKKGKLFLEWSLPGDWPTWSVEGTNEPVPETVASYDRLDKKLKILEDGSFFTNEEDAAELAAVS